MTIIYQSEFDHHTPEYAQNWRSIYAQARQRGDAIRSEQWGGFTVLLRHQDVQYVLRESAVFSSGRIEESGCPLRGGVAIPPNGHRIGFIEMDPPEHDDWRALTSNWFKPKALHASEERVEQIVDWAIDRIIETGECDFAEIANVVPPTLILDVLGLPLSKVGQYLPVLRAAVDKEKGSFEKLAWLIKDLENTISSDAHHPEGLAAALMDSQLESRPIEVSDAVEVVMELLFGGSDTTIATAGHSMLQLTRQPELKETVLNGSPRDLKLFVEEVIRYYSPAMGNSRTVMESTKVGTVELNAGDRVLCAFASANNDESFFENADEFISDRFPNPHVGFGSGIHACLGQHLARMDAQILIRKVVERMPDIVVRTDDIEVHPNASLTNGYRKMPVCFTPGSPNQIKSGDEPNLTASRFRA